MAAGVHYGAIIMRSPNSHRAQFGGHGPAAPAAVEAPVRPTLRRAESVIPPTPPIPVTPAIPSTPPAPSTPTPPAPPAASVSTEPGRRSVEIVESAPRVENARLAYERYMNTGENAASFAG
jgi:hypothetical protein